MEVILAEFGCEAMNTFTALEIARGYVVAHPHMFDVIQIGGYIGALAERGCAGTCPLLRPIESVSWNAHPVYDRTWPLHGIL